MIHKSREVFCVGRSRVGRSRGGSPQRFPPSQRPLRARRVWNGGSGRDSPGGASFTPFTVFSTPSRLFQPLHGFFHPSQPRPSRLRWERGKLGGRETLGWGREVKRGGGCNGFSCCVSSEGVEMGKSLLRDLASVLVRAGLKTKGER